MTGFLEDFIILSLAAKLGTGLLIKATVVLAIAGLAALVLRHSSAAYRSAIWSTALALLIVLPLLSFATPSWELAQIELPGSSATKPGPAEGSDPILQTDLATSGSITSIPDAGGSGTSDVGKSNGPVQRFTFSLGLQSLATAFLAVWFVGVVFLLSRLALHASRVRGICRRSLANDEAEISGLLASALPTLGICRPVRVLWSDETSLPFTCGLWRSTVVLPISARHWTRNRKRSVLLHELAHVARRDYVAHLLIEVACAMHWPNPFVWYAEQRNAIERERACDDYALRYGTPSDVYASELLQIARLQVSGLEPVRAVTMAGRVDLTGRVRNIMAKRISRTPIDFGGLLLILYVALVFTLPLSYVDVLGLNSDKGNASKGNSAELVSEDIPTTRELIRDLRDADDPNVRRQAAWWLGEHEDERAVEPLIDDGLRDRSANVRLVSAWALGEIKDDSAIDPLINVLENDADPLVREMAALSLGEIEDPHAIDPLVEALDREEGLAGPVIWALGEIGTERAKRARRAAVASSGWRSGPNDQVWAGSLRSKGFAFLGKKLRKRDCKDALRSALNELVSRDYEDRVDAAFDIGTLGISGCQGTILAVKPLLESLRDPIPEVRAMAVWALDEINPSRWSGSHQNRDHKYY